MKRESLGCVSWTSITPRTLRHHRFNIFSGKGTIMSFACELCIAYFLKPYFFSQFPGFAYKILLSIMKYVSSSYSQRVSAEELVSYNANLRFSSFKYLNPLSSLVILFCIGNYGHCVMDNKKDRLLMWEIASCGIFQHKLANQGWTQLQQKIARNQIIKIFR